MLQSNLVDFTCLLSFFVHPIWDDDPQTAETTTLQRIKGVLEIFTLYFEAFGCRGMRIHLHVQFLWVIPAATFPQNRRAGSVKIIRAEY